MIQPAPSLSVASVEHHDPAISIITVAYNDLENLRGTLANLFALPHGSNLEFIVIDGGSKDGTREYLQGLSEPRLRWISEPDKGLYDAMNKGIERAEKPWLWFINAGDTVDAALLRPALTDSSQALIFVPVLDNGKFVRKRVPQWQIPYCHQGTLFRRDASIRYDTRLKIGGDYKYMLQYLRTYKLHPRNVPIQRINGAVVAELNGISRQNRVARDIEACRISLEHFGVCSNVLFFAALMIYQYSRRWLNRKRTA
ncbi:MAG: glycosyltransferase [Holosporales bacterium]|jgi:glycosyltransferase involved in cell wall biosynthesis